MAVDLAPPRSHVDTPAWQSFEMRMRARAAEHRAAKRKRRFRYVVATLAATLVGAGAVVAIEERPVLLAAWPPLTWPEPPAAPSLSLSAGPTPLPLPTNWDVAVEQQIVEPLVIEQPVDSPPSERLTAQSERSAPAVETPVRRAPREIEWPPPPRETSGPPVETARLAEPSPTPLADVPVAAPPPAAPTPAAPTPAAPTPAATTPAATTPVIDPRESIRRAIERYREAYDRLDVSAAQAVWPRVDAGALARAFNSLSSQKVSFESCAITVSGTSADANCSGRSTVVPKLGGGSASARRTWQFRLREAGRGEWVIQSATVK